MLEKFTNIVKQNRSTAIMFAVIFVIIIICAITIKLTIDHNEYIKNEETAIPPEFPTDPETGEVLDGKVKYENDGTIKGTNIQVLHSLADVEKNSGLKLKIPDNWKDISDFSVIKNASETSSCADGYECNVDNSKSNSNTVHLVFNFQNPTNGETVPFEFYAQKNNYTNLSGLTPSETTTSSKQNINNVDVTFYNDISPYSFATWYKDGISYSLSTSNVPNSLSFLIMKVTEFLS